jgi:hypothetical protein
MKTPTLTAAEFRKMKHPTKRKTQPETAIRKAIVDYLRLHGWKVVRIVQGVLSEPGIPDLVAIRDGWHVWIEVKTPTGRLSAYQENWLQDLKEHGGMYIVARGVEDVIPLARRRESP